jgi:hypothetical protein
MAGPLTIGDVVAAVDEALPGGERAGDDQSRQRRQHDAGERSESQAEDEAIAGVASEQDRQKRDCHGNDDDRERELTCLPPPSAFAGIPQRLTLDL